MYNQHILYDAIYESSEAFYLENTLKFGLIEFTNMGNWKEKNRTGSYWSSCTGLEFLVHIKRLLPSPPIWWCWSFSFGRQIQRKRLITNQMGHVMKHKRSKDLVYWNISSGDEQIKIKYLSWLWKNFRSCTLLFSLAGYTICRHRFKSVRSVTIGHFFVPLHHEVAGCSL